MLKIALPNKGRLAEEVRRLLGSAGLEARTLSDRALTATLSDEFEAIFVRAQDIPEFVADGVAAAGITGWDLIQESGRALDPLLDLEFGRCRLVVAAHEESGIGSLDEVPNGARVATCFAHLTTRFFARRDRRVEVIPMSGAVESAPHLGIADVIVDLTSTGSTLKTNGLIELATVLESTARLVACPSSTAERETARRLAELTSALNSVLRARGERYLMANVPRAQLADVRELMPGLNGPTVLNVLDGGAYVAVHAVVRVEAVYQTVNRLKALGCEGILVTQIERLMP